MILQSIKRVVAIVLLLPVGVWAAQDAKYFTLSGGVSKTNGMKWERGFFSMDKVITFKTDANELTKIEGNICNTQLGLSLGANVNVDDNRVGEANRVMGYVGIKQLYLRYQEARISGTTQWEGLLVPGQSREASFDKKFIHVDLLYWKRSKTALAGMPYFFGIGYTSFAFPFEIDTLFTRTDRTEQYYGKAFYEPNFTAKYYSFLFGFDTFASSMLYLDAGPDAGDIAGGFGIFFTAEDRFGFGESRLSPEGLAAAQLLNPGLNPVNDHFTSTYIENVSSIGLRWRSTKGAMRFAVGLGYELSFFMVMDFDDGARQSGDLGFQKNESILRHGPIVRAYMRW